MTGSNGPSVLVQMTDGGIKFLRRGTIGRRNDKAKGQSEADGMETEGIIYADGTSQRLLVHHVCMYK